MRSAQPAPGSPRRRTARRRASHATSIPAALAAAALAWASACGESREEPIAPVEDAVARDAADAHALDGPLSPNADVETFSLLRRDLDAPRHASDGGGRAWIEAVELLDGAAALTADGRARFDLVYEAGPLGVAVGGVVFLQASPFWGWDTPQTSDPDAPGFTVVRTEAPDVALLARTLERQLLAIEIAGRPLREKERIAIRFGAGPLGARVDRFAERDERLWFAVDGDGDGVRRLIDDSPRVDVGPGPPARLRLIAPSVVRPAATATLRAVWFDAVGNAAPGFVGRLRLEAVPSGAAIPAHVDFDAAARGRRAIDFRSDAEGVLRIVARSEDGEVLAESNPVIVSDTAPRILWSDLHGHSQLSDGTGRPEDYFEYARDVAGLDVAALTDHDHWGLRFLDARPDLWARIGDAVRAFHEPGRFVTLLGYEWTSWLHGHRHVLYFEDAGRVWSSIDDATLTPDQLWAALAGSRALTFAHHSAGGPVATDWTFRPPPELEPVTEIVSVHGSSEALDTPGLIHDPVPGNTVRDVLDAGLRLGFIGSGDSHDGHPGLAQLASPQGGLAAIFAEEATRDAVLDALRRRRCYATNGPRIWMRTALDGRPMGALVSPGPDGATQRLEIAVLAPGELDRVEIVRSGALLEPIEAGGEGVFSGVVELPALASGEYLYVRAVQRDGGAAWSSPFFVE